MKKNITILMILTGLGIILFYSTKLEEFYLTNLNERLSKKSEVMELQEDYIPLNPSYTTDIEINISESIDKHMRTNSRDYSIIFPTENRTYRALPLRSISKNHYDVVDFSDNNISILDINLDIRTVSYLNVSNNRINTIRGLERFSNLKIADFSHNELSNFLWREKNDNSNYWEVILPYLHSLDLSYNRFEYLNVELYRIIPNLQRLDLSHNQLKAKFFMDDTFMNMKELDLSHNDLEEILVYGNIHQLEKLDLSNNPNLNEVDTRIFNFIKKLKAIDVRNTNLTTSNFFHLKKMCNQNNIRLLTD